jgi:hypothetical protein
LTNHKIFHLWLRRDGQKESKQMDTMHNTKKEATTLKISSRLGEINSYKPGFHDSKEMRADYLTQRWTHFNKRKSGW